MMSANMACHSLNRVGSLTVYFGPPIVKMVARRPYFFSARMRRTSLKRLTVACLFLVLLAQGAGASDSDIAELRKQAADFERQAAWDKAAEVYERILDRDRQLPEIRERY